MTTTTTPINRCFVPLVAALVSTVAFGLSPAIAKEVEQVDIDSLISQLSAHDFKTRLTAQRDLEMAGIAAVPALVEAAASGDPEAKYRSLQILEKLSSSSDESTIAALGNAAKSGSDGSAEIAKSFLKLANSGRSGEVPIEDFVIPGMDVKLKEDGRVVVKMKNGQRINLNHKRKGDGGINRTTMNSRGNTVISGSSDGEMIVIVITPEGAVRMIHSIEKGDEAVETKAYQYKNEKELKEKNPELHKLYAKYGGGKRMPRVRAVEGLRIELLGDRIKRLEVPGGVELKRFDFKLRKLGE